MYALVNTHNGIYAFRRKKIKKQVRFDQMVRVILIPRTKEYNFIRELLWYDVEDYIRFRQELYI